MRHVRKCQGVIDLQATSRKRLTFADPNHTNPVINGQTDGASVEIADVGQCLSRHLIVPLNVRPIVFRQGTDVVRCLIHGL